MNLHFSDLFEGNKKNLLIGILMIISFLIIFPIFIKVIQFQIAPYSEDEIIITSVSYTSDVDGENHHIVGNLFQPSPKFGEKEYPAIIACHPYVMGLGKEFMQRWCVELTKRGFVVLAIDLPGNGMSVGEMDALPREDIEPSIIEDGIKYLKGLDFVKGSKIGLIGHSYGATAASISAGVLGDKIDALIALNGFMNFTNWLIESILPDNDVKFNVKDDYIEIEKIDGKKVTKDNIKEWLRLYGIIRGDERKMKDLIISGTTRLDRDFLKKFDAVEYLHDVKDDSVLFIHSEHDKTFDKTNQSGQGYNSIINSGKNAHYILVDDNHEFTDDSEYTTDYCIINFFEEKLKKVDLGDDWENDYEKYSQDRDIELSFSPFYGFELIFKFIFYFALSLIPFFLIIKIIFYNKKISKNRAEDEKELILMTQSDPEFFDFSFGGGSYYKTLLFLFLSFFLAFVAIIGMAMGFFSEIIAGTLCSLFYLTLYLTLYFVPDQAEVDLWNELKTEKKKINKPKITSNTKPKVNQQNVNGKFVLLILTIIIIISSIVGMFATFLPKYFYLPLEQIIFPILIIGGILLISGVLLICFIERRQQNGLSIKKINWEHYSLDKYSVIKSIVFGSVIFLNILFQWNIIAFYSKLLFMISPHTLYYLYFALAVVLFFAGIQVFMKIFKEKIVKPKIKSLDSSRQKKHFVNRMIIQLSGVLLGLCIIFIVSFLTYFFLLNTTLYGNFSIRLFMYLALVFLIAEIIKIIFIDKSLFGISVFIPLTLFTVYAFLLHI